jgi:hypothetical protein
MRKIDDRLAARERGSEIVTDINLGGHLELGI